MLAGGHPPKRSLPQLIFQGPLFREKFPVDATVLQDPKPHPDEYPGCLRRRKAFQEKGNKLLYSQLNDIGRVQESIPGRFEPHTKSEEDSLLVVIEGLD